MPLSTVERKVQDAPRASEEPPSQEELFAAAERELREAQRVGHLGSWGWDARTDEITWSEEQYRIYGLDPSRPPPDFEEHLRAYTPASAARLRAAVQRSMQVGEPYELDLELAGVAGPTRWLTARSETVRDAEGRIIGLRGTAQDITERKRAEEATCALNRKLRAAGRCTEALLRAVDEQQLLLQVCRIACDDAGYRMAWVGYAEHDEARTVRPMAWAGVEDGYVSAAHVTWADTSRGRDPTGVAIRTGQKVCICIRDLATDPDAAPWRDAALERGYRSSIALPLRSDGATFGALSIYSAEPGPLSEDEARLLEELADDLAFGIGVLRARRRLEEVERGRLAHVRFLESLDRVSRAIQAADGLERMMQDVLDVALELFRCDRAYFVYPCDPDARTWTVPMERTRPEWPGLAVAGGSRPMDPDVAQTFRLLLAAEGPVRFGPDTPNPLPADVAERFGFRCFMAMALRPKVGKAWQFGMHQCTHVRAWTPDEERLMQEMGRRLADALGIFLVARDLGENERTLERRVVERTAALEAANRELEAFTYSVSHDLRAPLRAVDGYRGLLERHLRAGLDAEAHRLLQNISAAAIRMGQLVDDLLSFTRMRRVELVRQRVDLGALVEEVIGELAPLVAGRSVSWRRGELPVVTGDRPLLRVVLVNLLSNALKFTRPRACAEVEIGSRQDERGDIIVFMRDNGVGFEARYAERIFGVFQRLHRAEDFPGTGIGLANVRRIVARHGGRTWAEGSVGQGATFYFSLPSLGAGLAPPGEAAASPEPAHPTVAPNARPAS